MTAVSPATLSITDLAVGDAYRLTLTGNLYTPESITRVTLMVKARVTDPDSAALLTCTIGTTGEANGIVSKDGSDSAGDYELDFLILDSQTTALVAGVTYRWGVTVETSAGNQYSPVPNASLKPVARVVVAP